MPELIFVNGKRQRVPYEKAAAIYQVLNGNKEPEDDKQADFCATVANVVFEKTKTVRPYDPNEKVTEPERDEELHAIIDDKSLKGYDKFKAIGQRLKEKKQNGNT